VESVALACLLRSLITHVSDNGLVIGRAKTKLILTKQPRSRNWTSFMETISATEVALTLVVIWKKKTQ